MKLRMFGRPSAPQEDPITVLGMSVSPRCGYCNRRFRDDDIVMLSASSGAGFHLPCQVELDRRPRVPSVVSAILALLNKPEAERARRKQP